MKIQTQQPHAAKGNRLAPSAVFSQLKLFLAHEIVSANRPNEWVVVVRDVPAKTVVELDHPGKRETFFVGSPNPSLGFVKDGVDIEAGFVFLRLHQRYGFLQGRQAPIAEAGIFFRINSF